MSLTSSSRASGRRASPMFPKNKKKKSVSKFTAEELSNVRRCFVVKLSRKADGSLDTGGGFNRFNGTDEFVAEEEFVTLAKKIGALAEEIGALAHVVRGALARGHPLARVAGLAEGAEGGALSHVVWADLARGRPLAHAAGRAGAEGGALPRRPGRGPPARNRAAESAPEAARRGRSPSRSPGRGCRNPCLRHS